MISVLALPLREYLAAVGAEVSVARICGHTDRSLEPLVMDARVEDSFQFFETPHFILAR